MLSADAIPKNKKGSSHHSEMTLNITRVTPIFFLLIINKINKNSCLMAQIAMALNMTRVTLLPEHVVTLLPDKNKK